MWPQEDSGILGPLGLVLMRPDNANMTWIMGKESLIECPCHCLICPNHCERRNCQDGALGPALGNFGEVPQRCRTHNQIPGIIKPRSIDDAATLFSKSGRVDNAKMELKIKWDETRALPQHIANKSSGCIDEMTMGYIRNVGVEDANKRATREYSD